MEIRHDITAADWLELVHRRELGTLLNPEMAARVSAESREEVNK